VTRRGRHAIYIGPVASISGVAHVTLTVRNLRASETWYRRVFGMERAMEDRTASYVEVVLRHRASGVVIGLREHQAGVTARFDDTRTGLDHLALTVPDALALVEWRQHLIDLGVECSELIQHRTGTVVLLHDPDHIPLELHCPSPSPHEEGDAEGEEDAGGEATSNAAPAGAAPH